MAFRLVTSAARRLRRVRSTICAQFTPREARIGGASSNGNQLGYKWPETEFASEPEPKADIFVHLKSREDNEFGSFVAYFLEEDGTVTRSPKYNISPPPSFIRKDFVFWSSCDGLIYLRDRKLDHVLWNPTTHEYKVLPHPYPQLPPRLFYFDTAFAMWHDHRSQDYKVLNLVHACLEDKDERLIDSTHYIDLYSLKTNSWKRIPCPKSHIYCWDISWGASHVCVSGIFYLVTSRAILSFDISTETFSGVPLPSDCPAYYKARILEYKGLLSCVYSKDEDRVLIKEYQLWVMSGGLWMRASVFHARGVGKPLLFSQDGKLLYFGDFFHDVVVFDFATGKSKHLGVGRHMIYPFVENFVPLYGISCIEESSDDRNNIKSQRKPLDSAARFSSSSTPIFSSLKDGMAFRLVTSATRRLPLCSRVRSTIFFSGSRAQFVPRWAVNTRIDGAPPMRNTGNQLDNLFKGNEQPDPCLSETTLSSFLQLWKATLSSCLQLWKADICPKPKPDIFVNFCDYYRDKHNSEEYFVAYSLKEDSTISPKYFIYPPSILAKGYSFSGASCNGLFHFHDTKSDGQALWNPTTGGYKILPKPFVELHPCLRHDTLSNQMWSDHRFEDYKVLNLVCMSENGRGNIRDKSYHMNLYSLKLNSWRRIPCTEFECSHNYDCSNTSCGACVSGVFYHKAYIKQTQTPVILSFDFSTETLSSLPLPDRKCPNYHFLDYKGLLSVLTSWWDEDICEAGPWKYELWIMSYGLWTRESVFHVHGVWEPLWFSPDGKLLYFKSMSNELLMFDRTNGKLNHLGVDWSTATGLKATTRPMMIPFFESSVQLN